MLGLKLTCVSQKWQDLEKQEQERYIEEYTSVFGHAPVASKSAVRNRKARAAAAAA